jgi:hypothetical protein
MKEKPYNSELSNKALNESKLIIKQESLNITAQAFQV